MPLNSYHPSIHLVNSKQSYCAVFRELWYKYLLDNLLWDMVVLFAYLINTANCKLIECQTLNTAIFAKLNHAFHCCSWVIFNN